MRDRTNYTDDRLPPRLRGQIQATEGTIRYLTTLTQVVDPGLAFGHADNLMDMKLKLARLQGEARALLNADNPKASAAASAGGAR